MDPKQHVVFQSELRAGSPELTDIFARGIIGANDTSAAVGYAPLTDTERLVLTVALALVDRFVPSARVYFDLKHDIQVALADYLNEQLGSLDRVTVALNTLDDPQRDDAGMYLTVLGTSAEGGDCGQVGRANRVNGLIALNRPSGNEAAAGKNPVSHVGKIYCLLTHHLAAEIYAQAPGVREVYVWLCS